MASILQSPNERILTILNLISWFSLIADLLWGCCGSCTYRVCTTDSSSWRPICGEKGGQISVKLVKISLKSGTRKSEKFTTCVQISGKVVHLSNKNVLNFSKLSEFNGSFVNLKQFFKNLFSASF